MIDAKNGQKCSKPAIKPLKQRPLILTFVLWKTDYDYTILFIPPETSAFLMFSGGVERKQWNEMG